MYIKLKMKLNFIIMALKLFNIYVILIGIGGDTNFLK
jgi:hypothetical protein